VSAAPALGHRVATAASPPHAGDAVLLPMPVKPLSQAVAELEARSIRDALAATGGNKLAASRLLGIARATLYEKLALARSGDDGPPD